MNDNLAIQDPLADKPITILISLEPDNLSRARRTATVTVGVQGEPPVFKRGAFEDVVGLINQAWLAFSVRRQTMAMETRTTQTETESEVVVAEEPAIEPEANAGAMPSSPEISQPSRPLPQNLSLF
jgi:hypothetical protein